MSLLLLSNSTGPDGAFLTHTTPWIREALGPARRIAFVPYASVTASYKATAARVAGALAGLGLEVESVHTAVDPAVAVAEADAVLVCGGNTFALLRAMQAAGLIEAIRARVAAGAPYVGWSAGANVASPTIRTTNDMPVVEPAGFGALGLVPFQINPHYTDAHPPGHRGETRAQRLAEFVAVNPDVPVVGLPEGTALRTDGPRLALLGADAVPVFDAASPGGAPVAAADLATRLGW
ncbi:MAG TPA: dipeptidase PepE [Rubricoccaceae bacterium]|jgi:dipeptidase E